jgi:hypothetical protein
VRYLLNFTWYFGFSGGDAGSSCCQFMGSRSMD